jgi:A/G-specific adenine glycosylase
VPVLKNPFRFPYIALREWYLQEKRDLPWRGSTDPYSIWLSEVILQQTRVDQGTPYYHRFLSTFPNVGALAAASEDEVLKLWEGLGYYSRARNLHAAAKQVLFEHKGRFPSSYEDLRSLKGIGPYTAAAIGSIAFGLPVACVDGNVIRVMARFHGITDPVDSTTVAKEIDHLALQALDRDHPGDHNQAMMELGATVCLPKNPRCEDCPLREGCVALRLGLMESIPCKAKRTKVRDRFFHYMVLSDGERTLVDRREGGDIWQGLYQFPLVESDRALGPDEALKFAPWADGALFRKSVGPLRHLLSHQRIHAIFFEWRTDTLPATDYQPVTWDSLHHLAFPRLMHHFLEKKLLADSEKV